MRRTTTTSSRTLTRTLAGLGLAVLVLAGGADAPNGSAARPTLELVQRQARRLGREAVAWYQRTPPLERVTWGGLAACAALGLGVALERGWRVRRERVIPSAFVARFQRRLGEGQLDRGKGLDYCELNPSPAARVALAAIRRWGRPVADLERAVGLARRLEADRLRRHVGTLRRVAAMSPLLGLLGTLAMAGRFLASQGLAAPSNGWGPALAAALGPLTAGVALAILALVAYDGLAGRVEALANDLDRLGAETVDAIALATPGTSRGRRPRPDGAGPARTPHQGRPTAAEEAFPPSEGDRD